MKYLVLAILLSSLLGCTASSKKRVAPQSLQETASATPKSVKISKPPDWYSEQLLEIPENFLVGYGSGKSQEVARAKSMNHISQSLRSRVESEYESRQQSRKSGSDIYENDVEMRQTIRIRSKGILEGLELLKSENVDGIYYGAYIVDNRPLHFRVAEKLPKADRLRKKTKSFFDTLPFSLALEDSEVLADYKIVYRDKNWKVLAGKALFSIEPAVWREGFFAETNAGELTLSVVPGFNLRHGDLYHIKARTGKNGYLSLFTVFENGQVVRLGNANRRVTSDSAQTYPDLIEYDGMIAENLTTHKTTRDMIVAILCASPETAFGEFPEISNYTANLNDIHYYLYGDLLQNKGDCVWSSRFLFIGSSR